MRLLFSFKVRKMTEDTKVHLTKEGKEKLEKELKFLVEEKRLKVVERLAAARTAGDLSENNDYATAKEELEFIDSRIADLEGTLADAVLIPQKIKKPSSVCLGCVVTVKNSKTNHRFCIVGEWEADPINKKISHTSPLGIALIGKKVGEEVEVEAPAGKVTYKVLAIE